LTRGAEAAVLAPGRAVRKDGPPRAEGRRKPHRGRERQSASEAAPSRLSDGRKRRPGGTPTRTSLRGERYRAARDPRPGEGCEPELTEAEGAPSSASSLLLLEGPSLRFRPRAGRSPGRVCRCEPAGERRKSSELRECS